MARELSKTLVKYAEISKFLKIYRMRNNNNDMLLTIQLALALTIFLLKIYMFCSLFIYLFSQF
jgi:hypothetical protein